MDKTVNDSYMETHTPSVAGHGKEEIKRGKKSVCDVLTKSRPITFSTRKGGGGKEDNRAYEMY